MRRHRVTARFVAVAVVLSLVACSSLSSRREMARKVANAAGFQPFVLATSYFRLAGFSRIQRLGRPVTVYIEGDGRAWLSRTTPSDNPTPAEPLVLRLAALDRGDNVVYLARPCQYVDLEAERHCGTPYWTGKRFAEEVIAAVDEAVGAIAATSKSTEIHLVGYSGGAAVAALVAARRQDIGSLRTVAGYLDHVSLNRAQKVSPLTESLDPIQAAPGLSSVPQIHCSGRGDKVVPSWVTRNFTQAVGNDRCASIRIVDATHREGWEGIWSQLESVMPSCR